MSDESEFKQLTELSIPFEPTPDQEHEIVVTTGVDAAGYMEARVKWQDGTSIPELLVATATLVGNLGNIMQQVALSMKQADHDYGWCLQNAHVLVSMAKALGQMAGTEDAGTVRPISEH